MSPARSTGDRNLARPGRPEVPSVARNRSRTRAPPTPTDHSVSSGSAPVGPSVATAGDQTRRHHRSALERSSLYRPCSHRECRSQTPSPRSSNGTRIRRPAEHDSPACLRRGGHGRHSAGQTRDVIAVHRANLNDAHHQYSQSHSRGRARSCQDSCGAASACSRNTAIGVSTVTSLVYAR